jgi:hypothetical protein
MTSPTDALAVVRSRAQAATGRTYPGFHPSMKAAQDLWMDEFRTWEALADKGFKAAAACAWARRTAAMELHAILMAAI